MSDEREVKRRKKMPTARDKYVFFLIQISRKIDENGNSLLHYVVETNNMDFIEDLIASDSYVNFKNYAGDAPLAYAVRHNCFEATKILLRAGARHDNSYFKDSVGPLHIAAREGFLDIAMLLIENGADVRACDRGGETPLHAVNRFYKPNTSGDRYDIAKALIDAGADVNAKAKDSKTPVLCAIESKFNEGVELLLKHAAMFHAQGGPLDFDPETLTEEQREYYAQCRGELDLMKAMKFVDSSASFFSVLVRKDISGYARNEAIVGAVEKEDVSQSFPFYGEQLNDRFSKEVVTQRLLKKASKGLSCVLQWNENSMRVIIDRILPYLDEKDLNEFANI